MNRNLLQGSVVPFARRWHIIQEIDLIRLLQEHRRRLALCEHAPCPIAPRRASVRWSRSGYPWRTIAQGRRLRRPLPTSIQRKSFISSDRRATAASAMNKWRKLGRGREPAHGHLWVELLNSTAAGNGQPLVLGQIPRRGGSH